MDRGLPRAGEFPTLDFFFTFTCWPPNLWKFPDDSCPVRAHIKIVFRNARPYYFIVDCFTGDPFSFSIKRRRWYLYRRWSSTRLHSLRFLSTLPALVQNPRIQLVCVIDQLTCDDASTVRRKRNEAIDSVWLSNSRDWYGVLIRNLWLQLILLYNPSWSICFETYDKNSAVEFKSDFFSSIAENRLRLVQSVFYSFSILAFLFRTATLELALFLSRQSRSVFAVITTTQVKQTQPMGFFFDVFFELASLKDAQTDQSASTSEVKPTCSPAFHDLLLKCWFDSGTRRRRRACPFIKSRITSGPALLIPTWIRRNDPVRSEPHRPKSVVN